MWSKCIFRVWKLSRKMHWLCSIKYTYSYADCGQRGLVKCEEFPPLTTLLVNLLLTAEMHHVLVVLTSTLNVWFWSGISCFDLSPNSTSGVHIIWVWIIFALFLLLEGTMGESSCIGSLLLSIHALKSSLYKHFILCISLIF